VINVIFRRIERGDGGPAGPTTSGPSEIDLENNRFKFIFAKWGSSDNNVAKFRDGWPFHREHGYRRPLMNRCLRRICCLIVAWILTLSPGVRVKFR
jgi:hypothetical protein